MARPRRKTSLTCEAPDFILIYYVVQYLFNCSPRERKTMTTTAPAPTPQSTRWLYQALAIVGIAVGIFIIAAGLYLVIFPMSCCAGM